MQKLSMSIFQNAGECESKFFPLVPKQLTRLFDVRDWRLHVYTKMLMAPVVECKCARSTIVQNLSVAELISSG
jgi:hypothetical protein